MANDAAPASTGAAFARSARPAPHPHDRPHGPHGRDLRRGRGRHSRRSRLPAGERPGLANSWPNLFVIGLALGAVYALIALGYSLVYGILRMINFAHGEVFMFGAFASFFFASAYSPRAASSTASRSSRSRSCSCRRIAVSSASRCCWNGSPTGRCATPRGSCRLITAIGASLFLQNTAQGFFGSQTRGYPRPSFLEGSVTIGGRQLRQDRSRRRRRHRSIVMVALRAVRASARGPASRCARSPRIARSRA